MRPLPSESESHKSAKPRRKMWLAVLVLIAIGYWFSQQATPETTSPISQSPSTSMAEQAEAAQSASTDNLTNNVQSSDIALENNRETLNDTSIDTAKSKAILNAPLPETDSLAKEEIDRLKDEKQRMAEQDKLAAEQLAMNKQLSDMKAEQIALVEQQIEQELAKLEDVKPSAK